MYLKKFAYLIQNLCTEYSECGMNCLQGLYFGEFCDFPLNIFKTLI